MHQLTESATGDSQTPRISGNGDYVYFYSDAPFFGDDADKPFDIFRVERATGVVERAGALHPPLIASYDSPVAVDDSGEHAAYTTLGDFIDGNPDYAAELWLIDRSGTCTIEVSGAAPTSLTATTDSGPIRFDFIRGEVANLAFAGETVDLGAVVCLEDDSPDHHTTGFEDEQDPPAGTVFFYLYRGSPGVDDPGSWGQSSTGAERQAGSGSCNP